MPASAFIALGVGWSLPRRCTDDQQKMTLWNGGRQVIPKICALLKILSFALSGEYVCLLWMEDNNYRVRLNQNSLSWVNWNWLWIHHQLKFLCHSQGFPCPAIKSLRVHQDHTSHREVSTWEQSSGSPSKDPAERQPHRIQALRMSYGPVRSSSG